MQSSGERRARGGLVGRSVAVAAALLAFVWAAPASADCPYTPYVDCGDGSCCPSGDSCCGGASGVCCKPGAVCSNGQCVDSNTTGTGTSGHAGTSTCPNGNTCSGGQVCCGDNLCYAPGSVCCGGSGTGSQAHGCDASQGETCCGDSCVGQGMICCNEHPAQGCVAASQTCCSGSCCDKSGSGSSGSNGSSDSKSGCQIGAAVAGGDADEPASSSPGKSGPLSVVVIGGALAWLSIRHRRRGRAGR